MTQKNETATLVIALLMTLGLVGGGIWWFTQQSNSSLGGLLQPKSTTTGSDGSSDAAKISFGQQSLLSGSISPVKQAGLKALADEQFDQAVAQFSAALQANPNDPESLIFLNNARIGKQKSYAIAVVTPMSGDLNGALEMLRGVAQAQEEINREGGINGVPLRVAIADDANKPATARQVAKALGEDDEILGVIGHYASSVTLAAAPVYQAEQLTAISPVSTSVKLSGFSPFMLRTVPSDYVAARALADHLLNKMQHKSAVVFFNSNSAYSQSLKDEFVTALSLGGGQIVAEVDLSDSSFSAAKSVEQAINQKAEALMLAADTSTLDRALQVVQLNRQRLKLLAGDDVYALKTLEVGGDAALGMVLGVPWHIMGNPNSTFPEQSRRLWKGDVNWRTALAYDATQALIAGLRQQPTRAGVHQALTSPNFSVEGASGTVRFLASGDRSATVQLVTVAKGQRSGTGYDFIPLR